MIYAILFSWQTSCFKLRWFVFKFLEKLYLHVTSKFCPNVQEANVELVLTLFPTIVWAIRALFNCIINIVLRARISVKINLKIIKFWRIFLKRFLWRKMFCILHERNDKLRSTKSKLQFYKMPPASFIKTAVLKISQNLYIFVVFPKLTSQLARTYRNLKQKWAYDTQTIKKSLSMDSILREKSCQCWENIVCIINYA